MSVVFGMVDASVGCTHMSSGPGRRQLHKGMAETTSPTVCGICHGVSLFPECRFQWNDVFKGYGFICLKFQRKQIHILFLK